MTTSAMASRAGYMTGEESNGWAPQEATPSATDSEAVEEVTGEVSGFSESADSQEAHAEVGFEAAESGEEFSEASPEALAETGEESAEADLVGEGWEAPEAGAESAGAEAAAGTIPEAGTATEGGQEFFPLLGVLAAKVVPLLASAAGPALASAVKGRLSPRANKVLARPRRGTDLVAVLQKLLAQAMQRRREAVEEAVDEALVEEVVQTMEVIIGTDDRIRINNTTKVPWRRYCALRIHFDGGTFRGTGFFIGPRTIITAGHCVYMHKLGWARKIEVIPACNGKQQPFGSAFATKFRSTVGWTKNKLPAADYGAIILPAGAFPGEKFGSFGFDAFPNQTLLATPAVLAGYPGDKPFAELWGMRRKIKAVTAKTLTYDHDTWGGQSGAPFYIKRNGNRYVVGIHNYGAVTGNSATRVTPAVKANFKKWIAAGGGLATTIQAPAPAAPAAKAQMAMAGAGAQSDLDE